MWFRRGLSLAVLVLASLVVGGAVTGPLFLRSAGESVLRDTLDQALPVGRIVSDQFSSSMRFQPLAAVERFNAARLKGFPTLSRLLDPSVPSLVVRAIAGSPGITGDSAPLVYREGVCADTLAVDERRGIARDTRGASDGAHHQRGHRGVEQPGESWKPLKACGVEPLDGGERLKAHGAAELVAHDAPNRQRLVERVAEHGLAGGPEEEGPGHCAAHDERGQDNHGQRQSPPEPHPLQHEAEISHGDYLTTGHGSPPLQPPGVRMVSQAGHLPGVRRDRAEQWTGIRTRLYAGDVALDRAA